MKVLIVSNYLPPKIGGIERISHELASSLQDLGLAEVTVACAKWPSRFTEPNKETLSMRYRVVYLPSLTLSRRLPIPNILSLRFWKIFLKFEKDYDLVLFQSHLFILNWLLAFKLKQVKRRIWLNQGCNYVPMKSKIGTAISFVYERIGIFLMSRLANEFIGQSRNTAIWASRKSNIRFKYLNNAINLDGMDSKNEYAHSSEPTKVLFVGRLVEGKGLADCIATVERANQILLARGYSSLFELTVVGSGELSFLAKAQTPSLKINYLGELSHEKVISEMQRSEILIQAYTQPEGVTTVTLEGLAAGMYIVSTPLGGDGILERCPNFMSGNIQELPLLLIAARFRNETRHTRLKCGYEFVSLEFSWKLNSKKLILGDFANI
jgi:glycosyltransferase involved in cell wall biosynthesis